MLLPTKIKTLHLIKPKNSLFFVSEDDRIRIHKYKWIQIYKKKPWFSCPSCQISRNYCVSPKSWLTNWARTCVNYYSKTEDHHADPDPDHADHGPDHLILVRIMLILIRRFNECFWLKWLCYSNDLTFR